MIAIALIEFVWAEAVLAGGHFELRKGEQYVLCRDFLQNLELYADEQPMVCDRKYHPSLKSFQLPEWKEVDVRDYQVLLKRMFMMYSALSQESLEDKRELYEQRWNEYANGSDDGLTIDKKIEQGVLKIWRGFFDIVNEGQKQVVLKVAFYPGCDTAQKDYFSKRLQPNYVYYVLNSRGEIDLTYWTLAHGLYAGDLVFYKGKIRRVQWNNGLQHSVSPLWLHGGIVISNPGARKIIDIRPFYPQQINWGGIEVCGFEYLPDSKE